MKLLATRVAVSLVAVASLSGAGAGVAGAASQPGNQPVSHTANQHRLCTILNQHKVQATRNQAAFAAGTAKFAGLEAKAQQAGHAKLATYWKAVVDRRTATLARRHAAFVARYAHPGRYAAKVAGTC